MKIAFCLSGLPRFVEAGYPSIYELIRPYETDIYIHTWASETPVQILNIYKPKAYTIDPKHIPVYDYNTLPYAWGTAPIYNMFSMYESIYKCNQLIQGDYDVVVRCRFDLCFHKTIPFEKYDISKIHTKYESHYKNKELHDQFAFSSQENMNHYADCFNHILDTYDAIQDVAVNIRLAPELILGRYIRCPVQSHDFNFSIIRI